MARKYNIKEKNKKIKIQIFLKNLKERDHVEELRVGGRITTYGYSRNRITCYGLDLFQSG
jgi:tRNA(Ile2) C34 agmatinyltransferase TiaS